MVEAARTASVFRRVSAYFFTGVKAARLMTFGHLIIWEQIHLDLNFGHMTVIEKKAPIPIKGSRLRNHLEG